MPRESRHESTTHAGPRSDINLEIISDDARSSSIAVCCTFCHREFTIPRTSLDKERQRARDHHCPAKTSLLSSPAPELGTSSITSVVVAPGGDGKRYLKDLGVDDKILSVHRRDADASSVIYAKMIDQTEKLLGFEVPQAMGYPRVLMPNGSQADLKYALTDARKSYLEVREREEWRMKYQLDQDIEWRSRVEAFNLLCNPNADAGCFTSYNLDKCFDLLLDAIPWDFDNAVLDDEKRILSCTPRLGTHLPKCYKWSPDKDQECILDFERHGPEQYLPVLLKVLTADCRTDRKECIFQLRSGACVKVWVKLDGHAGIRKIYPQLDDLLDGDVKTTQLAKRVIETERRDGRLHTHVSFVEPPTPPPEEVQKASLPKLTNEAVCGMLKQQGCVADFACPALMPPSDDEQDERRRELESSILEAKAVESLELLQVVNREDPFLTQSIHEIKLYGTKELETHTQRLLRHLGRISSGCQPRPLPDFEKASLDELESYVECNALHKQITLLHARGGCNKAPSHLDRMGNEELAKCWAELTD